MEAWDIITTQKIDCLVTDIDMPVMNGIELIRKMKENNYDIKTIMVSGNYDLFSNGQYAEVEVAARIRKPFPPSDLIKMMRTSLER